MSTKESKPKIREWLVRSFALPAFIVALAGCNSDGELSSNEQTENSETVSLYQKNRGLLLPEEVRASLGVTLIDVEAKSLSEQTNASSAVPLVVPESALIQGVQEDFVYVENGEHFVRTPVVVGTRRDGWLEITEGLLPGDKVVAKAAHDLWMIELLALRGGSPCCPVPKKASKS